MYSRLLQLPSERSFFLFGQRGTGKSTLLTEVLEIDKTENVLKVDLLDSRTFQELARAPWEIRNRIEGYSTVFIDEIQKVPTLLDEVHKAIEEKGIRFALTGSSARTLKRAGVNLLAGRALNYRLYPLSYLEMVNDFKLDKALQWGSLPESVTIKSDQIRTDFLYTYVDTYLKEEIALEQLVRDLQPFNRFLEVAARCNGEAVNYTNIASDIGISSKSIKSYYEILEDTLIGFRLPSFHKSVRKQQKKAPKFYFHDVGLVRALTNRVNVAIAPQTSEYGRLFESFIINEFVKLNEYFRTRLRFYHLRVGHQDEVDLIVEAPDGSTTLIEIKSSSQLTSRAARTIKKIGQKFDTPAMYIFSNDETHRVVDGVKFVHWKAGFAELFER